MKVHLLLFSLLTIYLASKNDSLVRLIDYSITLKVDSSFQVVSTQESLLESLLETLISGDDAVSASAFLEANSTREPCQRLLEMWNL